MLGLSFSFSSRLPFSVGLRVRLPLFLSKRVGWHVVFARPSQCTGLWDLTGAVAGVVLRDSSQALHGGQGVRIPIFLMGKAKVEKTHKDTVVEGVPFVA